MTQTLSSYITVNTQRLYYKDQPVNAAQRNEQCVFETHELCGQTADFFNVKVGGIYTYQCSKRVNAAGTAANVNTGTGQLRCMIEQFVVFLSSPCQMPAKYLKQGHDCFDIVFNSLFNIIHSVLYRHVVK
jgi:hypothetical protein